MIKRTFAALLVAAAVQFPAVQAFAGEVKTGDVQKILAAEFGLPGITVNISAKDLADQSALDNKVSFEDALRQAMKSFLEDGEDAESPLAILANMEWPQSDPAVLTSILKEKLNNPGTVLSLVKLGDVPEYGEAVSSHWIFHLDHTLSDHMNWAIVARDGNKPAYNYGFN